MYNHVKIVVYVSLYLRAMTTHSLHSYKRAVFVLSASYDQNKVILGLQMLVITSALKPKHLWFPLLSPLPSKGLKIMKNYSSYREPCFLKIKEKTG